VFRPEAGESGVSKDPAATAVADRPVSDAPSRPLSDPDLTPLMGIPVVRPLSPSPTPRPAPASAAPAHPDADPAADDVRSADAAPAVDEPDPAPEPEEAATGPVAVVPPLPSWRTAPTDDDVVSMLVPASDTPPRVVTGSPQPVWFRVVRRDGEPVGGAVVTLLDDRGVEVDATKTATDGGGELHAPHGGRFMMIASGEGFQPRAAILGVDDRPVEVALLLPRSAVVAGAVRADGTPVPGARVVAHQEGEVVDQVHTDRDGGYRLADLAEGCYMLSAASPRGGAVRLVTLSEGAEERLDLDLDLEVGPAGGAPAR
jgi:hypothetical protein